MSIALSLKKKSLLEQQYVQEELNTPLFREILHFCEEKGILHEIAFLSVLAIGQGSIVFRTQECVEILESLIEIELFYESLGGILGYHNTVLSHLHSQAPKKSRKIKTPPVFDLTESSEEGKKRVLAGIYSLAKVGMLFPLGGLGDRLNLRSSTGDPLPVALLPFCGRTLLEGLIRDIQALEYLYFKLFKRDILIPIAIMTSFEKENHSHVKGLLLEKKWFNRPERSFVLFPQISVPVITEEGEWSMRSVNELNLHPGGHGAIWRMAEEKGIFSWFHDQKKESLLVRQINNPVAGVDNGLLALLGTGEMENKTFGFITTKRAPNTAEGVLVEAEDERGYRTISNIEYTDFDLVGVDNSSPFPTNTNILYLHLPRLLPFIKKNPMPGLLLNMKSEVPFIDAKGNYRKVKGGRLESMMQNISDSISSPPGSPLQTFLLFNERKKTISVTKRSHERGKSPLETPLGAFLDMQENGASLLEECGVKIENPLIFLYHPSLGPLYDIIKQKIRGGKILSHSELHLEIAEILFENVTLNGSLVIEAENVTGHLEKGRLCISDNNGKCVLRNVTVEMERHEKCTLSILGNGEFCAEDVTLQGSQNIVVPSGMRITAFTNAQGKLEFQREKIETIRSLWDYQLLEEEIELVEGSTFQMLSLQDTQSQPQGRRQSLKVR